MTPGDQRRADNKQKMKVEAVCVFIHPATAALSVKKKKKTDQRNNKKFPFPDIHFFFQLAKTAA